MKMLSTSSPSVNLNNTPRATFPKPFSKRSPKCLPQRSTSSTKVSEKGDAGIGKFEIGRAIPVPTSPQIQLSPHVRRQSSAPSLPGAIIGKTILPSQGIKRSGDQLPASSRPFTSIPSLTLGKRLPALAHDTSSDESPICAALLADPKLRALCKSLGINQSPDTLVGPIEKGQLIIGTLQETLTELIRYKVRRAARKGERFHIQQTGLDAAVRALENAERSLRTIKESKQPALGRARTQPSTESVSQRNQKTADAVIRILSNTKEKFDRMENGLHKLMGSVSFVSYLSSPPLRRNNLSTKTVSTASVAATTPSGSRRTTAQSLTTTAPATPHTASYSRARTSASQISVGSKIEPESSETEIPGGLVSVA